MERIYPYAFFPVFDSCLGALTQCLSTGKRVIQFNWIPSIVQPVNISLNSRKAMEKCHFSRLEPWVLLLARLSAKPSISIRNFLHAMMCKAAYPSRKQEQS